MAQGTDAGMTEAKNLLVCLDEQMCAIHRINVRIEALILLAVLHFMRREDVATMKCLSVVLDLAEPGGWVRSFINAGPPMMTMLEHFLRRNPGHDFAKNILAAFYMENTREKTTGKDENKERRMSRQVQNDILTRRETELLPLLAQGLSNKQIAVTLFISEGTVKAHLKNIFRKLKVSNRIEVVNSARRMGILTLD